jgi:hypothetical protein
VDAVFGGHIKFIGKGIISQGDLDSLAGGHKNKEDNFLTNFVIDEYLQMIKTTREHASVFSWEIFEKFVVKKLLTSTENLLDQNVILVQCNLARSEHWFLLVVLPTEKLMVELDSMSGTFVKPTAEAAMKKMWMLLRMIDNDLQANQ